MAHRQYEYIQNIIFASMHSEANDKSKSLAAELLENSVKLKSALIPVLSFGPYIRHL